jgi:hypothetical protein
MRLAVLVAVVAAALPAASVAQGTSGAQFLGVGVGARAAGMGGAYVSISDDGTALHWNPAGLTRVGGNRLTLSHVSWLSDATYQYASYAAPFGRDAAYGVALEKGSLSWDNTGEGSFEAGDFAGMVGYGRRLSDDLGVGGGLKFVSSSLGDDGAASYALDMGVVYRLGDAASVGAAVRNIGPGLTFDSETDPLPSTIAVGGSYVWRGVLFSADVEKVNDLGATPRLGAEYSPVPYLALRGGWIGGDESALSGVTGGLGFNWKERWALDYAYRSSDLGGTHQFALSTGFGAGAAAGVAAPSATAGGEAIPLTTAPKTNLTVVSELTKEVMAEAVAKMELPAGSHLHLRQMDTHDANWLVKAALLEELTSRGHVVRAGQMPAAAPAVAEDVIRPYEIAYRIVYCETTLPRSWREWVVGARKFERRTAVDIRFELSNDAKTIIWADGITRERREIIPGARIAELGSPGQSFISPVADPGGWDKVFEPVIVAGIVGGLIYLFYTSRSTD